MKHVIDLDDFSLQQLQYIIDLSAQIMQNSAEFAQSCKGKIMATLFYEPSTRTQMSFQAAMKRLGGDTIGFDNPMNSSVAKGESLKDTIKIIAGYVDIIAMRHPMAGSAKAATFYSDAPVINGGDGSHLHPTQTLTDVITLCREKGTLNNHVIGLCGDLKNGRTVHSLAKTMSKFEGNSFVLISTPQLALPDYIKNLLDMRGCKYTEVNSLKEAIGTLDVLYMTRIQGERFDSPEEYEKQKGVFVLDRPKMELAKNDLIVLHPLPRVDEIALEVDDDPRALYFKQAVYGMYGRMALIHTLLNNPEFEITPAHKGKKSSNPCCNAKCITQQEKYLYPGVYDMGGEAVCEFCEEEV
ncbi:MAG: aspartate carbamoyltransferase [Oscillospiraceae bacterium]|jgi:aspartate carbamoyltransferase catalytic subunit|nr:aspartate carbamoyltransferase [Oscillospiraceae bacterium]